MEDNNSLPPPPLSAPRFGIRTLLLAVGLIGLLLACFRWFGGLTASVIALVAAIIAAHVAGNALGWRLRQGSSAIAARQPREGGRGPGAGPEPLATTGTSRLRQHSSLWLPLLLAASMGGGLGTWLGYWYFGVHDADRATLTDTALGMLAFALLGAMAAGAATGFAVILCLAWRDAIAQHDADARVGVRPKD